MEEANSVASSIFATAKVHFTSTEIMRERK